MWFRNLMFPQRIPIPRSPDSGHWPRVQSCLPEAPVSTVLRSHSDCKAVPVDILTVQDRATPVRGQKVSAPPEPQSRCVTCSRSVRLGQDCGQCVGEYLHERVHGTGFVLDLNVFTPPMADRRAA